MPYLRLSTAFTLAAVGCGCGDPRHCPADASAEGATGVVAPSRPEVSYESLLAEAMALETLARPNAQHYRARMASSFDRASVSPDEPGWFGNADAAHFLREEMVGDRTEHVLLDVEGPGAVTRIWTAKPVGTLRIYVDGEVVPSLSLGFEDFFEDIQSSAEGDFSYRIPHGEASNCGEHVPDGAANYYLPIPYARSLKITLDDPDTYYQVSYREYAEVVSVGSWSRADVAQTGCVVEEAEVAAELWPVEEHALTVEPGARTELRVGATAHPGSAIRQLAIDLGRTDPETLRALWVTLAFDGQELVRGPLAEVFGQGGPGIVDSESALFSVRGSRMVSRLVMPFREEVTVAIESGLAASIEAVVEIEVAPFDFGAEDWFLHGHWTPPFVVDASELSEARYLTIVGGGRYIGNVLNVRNSSRVWWGEGDEKIWIDDEPFPSFFGTGTEDYYGFAWCSAAEFSELYHGQTRVEGPELYGHLSMYRWHVGDSIPFDEGLAFDLETRHWREYARVGYEALHLWYGPAESRAGEAGPIDFEVPAIPAHDPELAGDGDIPHDWTP